LVKVSDRKRAVKKKKKLRKRGTSGLKGAWALASDKLHLKSKLATGRKTTLRGGRVTEKRKREREFKEKKDPAKV